MNNFALQSCFINTIVKFTWNFAWPMKCNLLSLTMTTTSHSMTIVYKYNRLFPKINSITTHLFNLTLPTEGTFSSEKHKKERKKAGKKGRELQRLKMFDLWMVVLQSRDVYNWKVLTETFFDYQCLLQKSNCKNKYSLH